MNRGAAISEAMAGRGEEAVVASAAGSAGLEGTGGATTVAGGAVAVLEGSGTRTGTGGRTGAAGACCWLIAFRTSPGREICERSIFVLMSGSPCEREARLAPPDVPSARARTCARTRSASSTVIELECVFFSVTPTANRTSRTSLLLTSSSLARSLIRILSIPAFSSSVYPAKSS